MSDANKVGQIIRQLLETDRVHASTVICEAVDKYLPIIDSLTVQMADGSTAKLAAIHPKVIKKVDETRKTLRREDRIMWALRHYKKALVVETLWLAKHSPDVIEKRLGSAPAPEQPGLERQLQRLSNVDISYFETGDLGETGEENPPCTGFSVIDEINETLKYYLELVDSFGQRAQDNAINRLVFQNQSFGQITSAFRSGEVWLYTHNPASIHIWPTPNAQYDMQDEEGPAETWVDFPNGWKWLNLHRNCSQKRNDPSASGALAVSGHCGNAAARGDVDVLELVQPVGDNHWRHHAMFVLDRQGMLGEMKGRKNQPPSRELFKYIYHLLKARPEIKGLKGQGYAAYNNFHLLELSDEQLDTLAHERPELFVNSSPDQLPNGTHIVPNRPVARQGV